MKASVVSLADLNDLQVELDINQNDFARITPHQRCNLVADAYPDRVYKGAVAEIAPEANRQKATIQVKVKVLQPDEYLRPEMTGAVGGNSMAPSYGGTAAPAGTANLRYIRPNDSASPPTPDNIGNYQPSTDAELRFLPPVN